MTSRVFAASVVVLGIAMVAPIETAARAGGFGAASPSAAGVARSSIAGARFAHMSPQHGFATSLPGHVNGFRMTGERNRRFPLSWGFDSPFYYPSDYGVPFEQPYYGYHPAYPADNWAERSRPVVSYQPGCRTDTEKVPSESGGEHTITITRCY
jgi:hypothetical protein